MAIQIAIPIDFNAFFPNGAAIISEKFEPVAEWSDASHNVGQHDKVTPEATRSRRSLPVGWQVQDSNL